MQGLGSCFENCNATYVVAFTNVSVSFIFQASKRDRMKKEKKAKNKDMTEDEMIAEQQRLINQAKLKVWGAAAEDA